MTTHITALPIGQQMSQEYGTCECKVCGGQVFVPIPSKSKDGHSVGQHHELTCSNGHTDAYDFAELQLVSTKPAGSLKVRRAVAGIG